MGTVRGVYLHAGVHSPAAKTGSNVALSHFCEEGVAMTLHHVYYQLAIVGLLWRWPKGRYIL